MRGDVPGDLGKHRFVSVDAGFIRQPDRIGVSGDRVEGIESVRVAAEGIGEIIPRHHIVLGNPVQLPLHEHSGRSAHRQVLRRRDANFVAELLKSAVLDHQFLRHDGLAIAALPTGAGSVHLVVEIGIVAVVGDGMHVAFHEGAGVHNVEIADLAFDRQCGLVP